MGRPSISARRILVQALSILGLAAGYFAAGKFGLSLALVNTSTTAVWPPTGIALAALLLLGLRVWPGIAIGAFLVNLTTTGDLGSSVGIAVGNTLEAIVGAHLVNKFANGSRAFERPQDVLKFAFFAALLGTVVSATIGTISLALAGLAAAGSMGAIWLTWWLGDASGAIVVAPVLLTWTHSDLRAQSSRLIERVALLAAVVLTGLLLFGGGEPLSLSRDPVAFLSFPVLIWAAYRFGPRETTAVLLIVAIIADWGTLHGFGPFARSDQNESLLLLQAFMGVAAVTSEMLAAAVLDRKRAEATVRTAEQRLRAVAEESARLREEFLSIATHELRTPLSGLRGYLQLAGQSLDRGQHNRVREGFQSALRQSDRLAALIAQLLDASQMQAGTLVIEPVTTDVSELVARSVEAERLGKESHRWVVEIASDLRASLDPIRFEQVVVNLLENAMKFTPAGGTIIVRLTGGAAEVRLEISDQGIGISRDRIDRIFERFYRAHDDRGLAGLGLGLYIARQIVQHHDGEIGVTSEPGHGSTFTVTVPRTMAEVARPTTEPVREQGVRTGRVLVVDDDPDIRALVAEVLRDAGISVASAKDGEEALAEAARIRPDVILLDKLMPGMDGTKFALVYRAAGKAAPIIAFCAARDAPQWAAAIGAVSYIGKPFDVKDLERLVLEQLPAIA
ncbi:MAG: response regulator [Chloroflexi bacterium]|nr:MAG: response regulator [Chloroflexota bacterium]